MSLNYARELLKISISQLCSAIGFDTISEIGIDILVDVCEKQFQYLNKQTSNLIQLNHQYQPNFRDFLSILLENNSENLQQLEEYMKLFKSFHFSKDLIQFPYKKRNQFYLRIPPKDSQQVLERDQNQTTEYIYDWLPLFPDQETPEQPSIINIDHTLDINVYTDQDKKIDKNDSHHPLTLLSFLSKNGDEPNIIPIGKRPNRSLPSIRYRPRRLIEIEAAVAAAEKAKKEQLEKENNEKDQQQAPPPLRLTIPKVNNDKPSIPFKKLTTTIDGTINKKSSTSSLINTNSPSINLSKKILISPPINHSNETHSQTNLSNNSSEISSNFDKNDDIILDLTKPSSNTTNQINKLPTLKLKFNNVQNSQITNTSETSTPQQPTPPLPPPPPPPSLPTATKKSQKSTTNTKPSTNTHEKVNLKIRTSSLPLFKTNSVKNETNSMISPTVFLPTESSTSLNESSLNLNPTFINDNQKKTTEILDSTNRVDQSLVKNEINQEEKKKKKKKKDHHHHHQHREEKRFKREQENNSTQKIDNQMDIDIPQTTITIPTPTPTPTTTTGGGAIRLKIKLGKPSIPTSSSDDISSSINIDNNEQKTNTELKPNSIRLTLPLIPSSSQTVSINSNSNSTSNKRKSGKIKRVPQLNEINRTNLSFTEDNTNSIDDLPLGERTSPNKIILNNIQTNLSSQQIISTPIKKKTNTNKKKTSLKQKNNIVGVAVIEERRIHHDSQEKIWICPSCNRPDNGQEAMIACDLCDDWYHWECVGIVEEPPESIPWFCPKCHRSNSSTTSAQGIKPSASSKAKRQRASALYQQKQQQQYPLI